MTNAIKEMMNDVWHNISGRQEWHSQGSWFAHLSCSGDRQEFGSEYMHGYNVRVMSSWGEGWQHRAERTDFKKIRYDLFTDLATHFQDIVEGLSIWKFSCTNSTEVFQATPLRKICHSEKECQQSSLLEQHLTVICGLALRQFPRYKSKHHGLTHKDEDKRKWVEFK